MLDTSGWKQVFAGRCSFRVPADTVVHFDKTVVNQVEFNRIGLGSQAFEQAWKDRVELVRSGKGTKGGETVLVVNYPGQHTMQWANTDLIDPVSRYRTLEHWQIFDGVAVSGMTVVEAKDLGLGQQAIRDVFASMIPSRRPEPGDFVLDGAVAHVPLNGAEDLDLSFDFSVPQASGETSIRLQFKLSSSVVSAVGNLRC